jgi:hypothetical protein
MAGESWSHMTRVFTTFRILEISYISNVFFCFVYHSKMAQISRNYTKFFYANLYKIPRYFEKFCDLLYQFFLKIQQRRHFLIAEKLQDADWGWGRYDNTPLNPYPFTAASRVFTTFRILEILYFEFFFVSYTIRKYTFHPDSNFIFFCFYTVLILNKVQDFKDICY